MQYLEQIKSVDAPEASIVKMPTGTGKTAIMALILNYDEPKKALIVVPSEALKSQTRDYINANHWIKTNLKPSIIAKAEVFEPSGLADFLNNKQKNGVYVGVCTTQALADIYYDKISYGLLKEDLDLIIVDEGHREPAKTWSKAVRELNKPVILFTATPYRNDLRFFRIGKEQFYRTELTFQEGVKEFKCIRNVHFIKSCMQYSSYNYQKNEWCSDINKYILSLQEACRKILENIKVDMPKIIIRCNSKDNIDTLMRYFSKGINPADYGLDRFMRTTDGQKRTISIGIHDRYTNDRTRHTYNTVSSIFSLEELNNDANAIFWIHQFKLMEGIDDYNFILISFYEPYSNARSLVQQIGRIIRKPDKSQQADCYVHCDNQFELESYWLGYLDYENIPAAERHHRIYGTEEIVDRITHSFPHSFYFSKKFSKVLKSNVDKSDLITILEKDLQIPKVTTLFKGQADKYKLDEWLKELSEWLLDNDIICLQYNTADIKEMPSYQALLNTFDSKALIGIFLGYEIKPSEFLRDSIFFDIKLITCTFLALKGYVFFRGNSVTWVKKVQDMLEMLSPKELQKLAYFADEADTMVKQAGFIHSEPTRYAKRRRSEGGRDLTQTAPYIDDHLHALTSVVCTDGTIRRYLGLSRGRITDGSGTFVSFKAYIEWAISIVHQLETENEENKYFLRFASPINPPRADLCNPVHLLCDYGSLIDELKETDLADVIMTNLFEEDSVPFDNFGSEEFELPNLTKILGIDSGLRFKLNYQNGRFRIKPAKKKDREIFENEKGKIIRDNIIIHVIANVGDKSNVFYTENQFFALDVPLWGKNRIEELGALYGLTELCNTTCEKYEETYVWPPKADRWPGNSIFSLIDNMHEEDIVNLNDQIENEKPFFIPDVILCLDQAGEMADFLLYKKDKHNLSSKIVVVHAKQSKTKNTTSAVQFAKIQEQVIKNLRFFDISVPSENEVKTQANCAWTPGNSEIKLDRIRKNSGNSLDDIAKDIEFLIHHGAQREVWVFYGQGFKCSEFYKELKKDKPNYWLMHLAYLLVNVNSASDKARAKLRIFTQP